VPAKSKQQQKFFGVVRAMQKGDIPKKGEAGEVADDMEKTDVKKMASTKHKGLSKKIKEIIAQELVKELKLNEVKPIIDPKLVSKPNDRIQYVATNDHRYPTEIVFIDTQTGHVVFFNIQRKEVERIAWNKLNSTHWVRPYIEKEFEGFLDGWSPSGKIQYEGKVNEAVYIDIAHAVKAIKDFNRKSGSFGPNENPPGLRILATDILHHLGFKPSDKNITTAADHLLYSMDGRRMPEDGQLVKELYPLMEGKVNELKTGNKINKARAKAHFKIGEKIAVVHKATKNAMPIEDIKQIDAFDTKEYDFAYITEIKLKESPLGKYSDEQLIRIYNQMKDEKVSGSAALQFRQIGKELKKRKVKLESKLKEGTPDDALLKSLRIQVPGEEFPDMTVWWEYEPEDIMRYVYWHQGQLPPTGPAFDKEWQNIVKQLHTNHPAPANIYSKKLKEWAEVDPGPKRWFKLYSDKYTEWEKATNHTNKEPIKKG